MLSVERPPQAGANVASAARKNVNKSGGKVRVALLLRREAGARCDSRCMVCFLPPRGAPEKFRTPEAGILLDWSTFDPKGYVVKQKRQSCACPVGCVGKRGAPTPTILKDCAEKGGEGA